jgi:hypothetical protein
VKQFFLTDAILKFRIKVLPEPYAANDMTVCKDRGQAEGGGGSYLPGYTKLRFNLNVYGVTSSGGSVLIRTIYDQTVGVNDCQSMDLSNDQENYPHGVFVTVENIRDNKGLTGTGCSDWWGGWTNCNNFKPVRSLSCVRMEYEVAADGTKTFD